MKLKEYVCKSRDGMMWKDIDVSGVDVVRFTF